MPLLIEAECIRKERFSMVQIGKARLQKGAPHRPLDFKGNTRADTGSNRSEPTCSSIDGRLQMLPYTGIRCLDNGIPTVRIDTGTGKLNEMYSFLYAAVTLSLL